MKKYYHLRYLVLFLCTIMLFGCHTDPEKHELKSPCVAYDDTDNAKKPCKRRPLAGNRIG